MPFYIYGMAYSILNTPGDYFSAHGDLIFTVKDDTKPLDPGTYPDYKYVCDIYVDGSLAVRLKAVPHPDTKMGVFSISNVVRNYLSTNLDTNIFSSLRVQKIGSGGFYIPIQCKFGEEYGFVTYTNVAVDAERTYFNHYNGRLGLNPRTILPAKLDKAITSRPYRGEISRTSNSHFVSFLPTDDTTIDVIVRSYNSSGLQATTTKSYTPTAASTNEQQVFNVSPGMINVVEPGFINNSIAYYTVEFSTTNIIDDSIYRFDITCEPKYQMYNIHFFNKWGGFDTKEFTKVSRKSFEVERSDFGKLNYTIDPTTGLLDYYNAGGTMVEKRPVYASSFKEKMTLNTDLLTDDDYIWLQELIVSPMVFIELNALFYPVIIKDNNYEAKKNINDDLTNLTLNIEFDEQFNTQYR